MSIQARINHFEQRQADEHRRRSIDSPEVRRRFAIEGALMEVYTCCGGPEGEHYRDNVLIPALDAGAGINEIERLLLAYPHPSKSADPAFASIPTRPEWPFATGTRAATPAMQVNEVTAPDIERTTA